MMLNRNIIVFCFFGVINVCVGQIIQYGQCNPNLELVKDFDLEKFQGTWYEVARTDNPSQSGDCAAFDITGNNVQHSMVTDNFLGQASGTISIESGTAKLKLDLPIFDGPIDFWVQLTDYSTFALVSACENISTVQRKVYIWILGRNRSFPNDMVPALISTAIQNTYGINSNTLKTIDHSDASCYVLPVIQPGQPIILPGQCDPNIPVVQNFNVQAYTGIWHQIASYQNSNSAGTCTRAQYTLANGVVNVFNRHVVNQALASISGTAVVSSNDNSAKLTVTLNVGTGTNTQPLWVLATDYTSYAVSYSCTNLPNNQRQVISWILSRTRQLPASAQAQVDNVVNSIVDLNYQYYQTTDQSDAACFYYPEPVPNQPVVFGGQCESLNVPVVNNFNVAAYMGLWHTIELYPNDKQTGTCSNAFYALGNNQFSVKNSHVVNEQLLSVNAVGVSATNDGTAKLQVTFPVAGGPPVTRDYWVLATDYTNYALVYSCFNINPNEMSVTAWKLSRTKQLGPASITAINAVINTVSVLEQRYFETMDQSANGCFYFPEPVLGQPVVFPGQCDNTIAAQPNFNFNLYQGIWHEVQAYPKDEVTGQCINHQYTLSGLNLALKTSSVYDQQLLVSEANVKFSSTDGSGKLIVTVQGPNGPIEFPYWVLSTDYTNYALAYACMNDGTDYRKVWSWKLSRTKELSAAYNTTINNVISNINVLDNIYYENIDQSDQACFYLPDIGPGESVILPGQCDTTIKGVANFDLAKYAGRWRLIESFASNYQGGTCNTARYTLEASDKLSITNSQVVDQELRTITGTAIFTSTDGTGQLLFEHAIRPRQFVMYILDTDYTSYSLAYGCNNVNNEQRRIYSWKLSRENTLSEEANNKINKVIDSIDVLNNRFYYKIDRSVAGCFYYPPADSNSAVIFPGQCDENIPVVTNFDAARYLGLWHDIESFPGEFQDGTCANAYYSLGNDVVDVYNTQVINQTLFSISGSAVLVPSTTGSAKLDVTFNVGGINVSTNYWVLATDYDTYSLVYSCRNIDDEFQQVTAWKLSRTKALTAAANTAINNVINTLPVIDQRYYIKRDQTPEGCFYYPEPVLGKPVVFPGQCDNTIMAQPNFNMNQFQGLWYEIEAYPKEEQSGQCINHQFSLSGVNNLDLSSSNVYDQQLNINKGNVKFSSTDGSGRLVITITVNGTAIDFPYWILSTDYTNYALAYACVNDGTDYRKVWSWKLSRTKQLNPASNNAINNAIANINVLNNNYYENVDQSDKACFYLPDINLGEPVIFPGQCDTSIKGVSNFNLAAYAGRWRLIEVYQPNFGSGTCNTARYTLTGNNAIQVVNENVVNQALATSSGSATVISTDGTGKLLFHMQSTNNNFEYIVLDTDYTSYALGYGCENINNQERRIYSWKLSRDNTLSADATNKINQVIDSIDVLNNRFYNKVDRSVAGCFYYPVPDSNTAVKFPGQCEDTNVPVVTNFDATKYLGKWNDIEGFPSTSQHGTCNNQVISASQAANADVNVVNSQVVNQALNDISGSAVLLPSTDGSAKLAVTFNIGGIPVTADYWVLATDYDSYSFVYSCKNVDDEFKQISAWKLSRTKALTPAANTAINNIINTLPILDQRYYVKRDHTPEGCFYFPEPVLGQPVVFPGQCDNTIAAQPNFNFNLYQGIWHEVQAYPKDEVTGQCINHQYTLSGLNLALKTSSVYDQQLLVSEANVKFSSTDGSGKLIVTVQGPNGPIEFPYWVLSTDYTNYALAYACMNDGTDYRKVWSWKLSRTKELSAAYNTTINNVISNINVLDNIYYENIDQSDQACFYLPDIGPGESVILPGQCDTTIKGVANFDLAKYAGRWRLIESFASNYQGGTCNTARYTLEASDKLSITNSQVVDQELRTITGTAIFTSTDGTGQLLFEHAIRPRQFVMYILDTDYTSYSLAYGCNNLNNEQRRIYSWKLSRENTLSEEANNKINKVIDSIDVLNNRFYYKIDRSVAGCFYYPPADSNSAVIFPGQCDENIPVVTNFDAARYLGLWHDIESFPGEFQDGTCANAYYSLGNDVVDVYNTQVINQTLFSISGSAVLVPSTTGSAKLDVTFNVGGINVSTNYWVLATDYDTYSLVYSCRNIDDEFQQVTAWKLSRTKALTAAANTAINNVINTLPVIDQRYYIKRDQTPEGCFYYPEPVLGKPVVFPGQCDNTIMAQPNFNMNQFQGLWYEIEAYPKEEQSGQCINHQFSLSGVNNLDLSSSNVYDQQLNINKGNVKFSSTDGSGRLVITITVNGTAIDFPYWILSTDYTNYALAYACVNDGTDYRKVWSWKLSRTKQLNPASNNAINNAIANINVLNNNYYENVDQSDKACFYLPDINLGEPVIFPGQCDTSIKGVSNFNLAAYAGRWRLIELYQPNFGSGTCNTARYTLTGNNAIQVINENVVNQALATSSGSATVISTDGTGKLLFHMQSTNNNFEFIVLDTDYTSYALGYGCENINNQERRIYSWKLSRDNTLSADATNKINQVIDSIDVLNNRFYNKVDRSVAGCFYYPVPDSNTAVKFPGQCEDTNVPVVTNFDATKYLGKWNDIEGFPSTSQHGTCNNQVISASQAANADVNVVNSQVVNQALNDISGSAVLLPSTDGSAKLAVTFNIGGIPVTADYWVLATDYDSYSFVYSCKNVDDEFKQISAWKLSRTKALTPAANTAINNIINTLPILDQRYYVKRDHTPEGCFYFPEPVLGQPVVFPGQCDNTITAVPNFNMNQFQGVWHEIQAYPKEQQTGHCINHQFTLNSLNTLGLNSFNVIGLTQTSSTGQVTFATNDGSGKLNINIQVDGQSVTIPFWILSTDYTSYALAYSCVNYGSDYRGVWSWKLSRTKALTPAASTTINNVINSIVVLDNMYYENIDQSDNACFHLPDLGPKDPVILPGQCDPNIPAFPNFDSARYLGTWRLVESYYSEFQEGTCNTATYSAAPGGSVNVLNAKVVQQQLETVSGTAVIASTDGSAKLIVTFPSNPTPVDYWVLDTDYDNYALVYTCSNINSEQRRVWSWKLSRTNTLSASAQNSINQVVNSINVLDAKYYQTIDRSDTGCFYFPAPTTDSDVIFPGQCDMNIPVVTNFNTAAYQGTWYDIESYPSNFQSGTCNRATYTLTPSGTIDVVHNQVIGQVLQTTSGTAVSTGALGEAKWEITFTLSSGLVQSTKYWVLATDYTSYSLIYSCRNIDEYTRAVHSWKLGRQQSLSAAANAAINNVINNVQVLDQQYYVQRKHTAEDCFYYPDNYGGNVILDGQCLPDAQVPAITNFNANSFAGTWHEVARFPSTLQNGQCAATQYTLIGNNAFSVTQTSVLNEEQLTTTAQATVQSGGRGVISANINGVPFNDIYILATDYNEYALAYACNNLANNKKQVYSWKLSRTRAGLSAAANTVINQIVDSNVDLFEPYYQYTKQDDNACFHYPDFDTPPPFIELPGPCDPTIKGIPNFNVASYLGRWYDTARYPQTAQSGQCNRAEFTDLGNDIGLVNSQVVSQSLATISGTVKLASTDNSGHLQVTFVINGQPTHSDYYVLATDYTDYAFVYTCENLANGNRHVGSWKLSRSKTLSAQANSVINLIISQTQGLHEKYYQPTSQSDESCFYIPPVNVNEAPLFRGQCEDMTGIGMPGFNVQNYLGWWHEIERYPVDNAVGECRSSRYTATGNTIQGSDISIFGLTADTLNSTVTISNDGKIQRVFSDNTIQDIWVLSTDYNNYALLYSCENVDNEYRRVWSAKHSRTRSLTAAAQASMATVIEGNLLLYPQFYQTVDQSDSACFHYPDQSGPHVILPGQCDTNINAVSNFKMDEFQGTWYQIERYDDVSERTCIGTQYSYDQSSGEITVIDYEVVDGELITREGTGSTGGSGSFSVVLPDQYTDELVTTNVYILTTDYESYALAYSCENIDQFHRRVGAWKLSRERTLSAAGNTQINAIITQREELHQPYFNKISQDSECPEPSSSLIIKSSIIVILVCAVLQIVF